MGTERIDGAVRGRRTVGGGLALGGGASAPRLVTVSPVARPSRRSPGSPRSRARHVSTSSLTVVLVEAMYLNQLVFMVVFVYVFAARVINPRRRAPGADPPPPSPDAPCGSMATWKPQASSYFPTGRSSSSCSSF